MIRPGLCSVAFRELPVEEIVQLSADAGLRCIEWGADVHVRPGDRQAARRAREATRVAGLEVASYGSYLRGTGTDEEVRTEAETVIDTALELGADRVRIWAGAQASAQTSTEERAQITRRLRDVSELAAARGIELGLEWHGGTLTDRIESAALLLEEVGHPALRAYWQPHQDQPTEAALADLRAALPWISTVHVFSWWPGAQRLPLQAREALWREAFALVGEDGRDHDALLEFVPEDSPGALPREAGTLLSLLPANSVGPVPGTSASEGGPR